MMQTHNQPRDTARKFLQF